jgi:hypothetical protein
MAPELDTHAPFVYVPILTANTQRHKFVFLCGLHKSGTSPLFRILRDHPQISGFSETGAPEDEGQHLQTVVPTAKFYGGPGRFALATQAHLTEKSELVNHENARRLFTEWSQYWNLSRPFLLEKSPPNLIRTRFLQTIFPDSYFITILRHPIAVSLATQKWSGTNLPSLFRHWLHSHTLFERDRPYLRNSLVIKYEDLIRNTQNTLDEIHAFLGLSEQLCADLNSGGNDRYFATWKNLATEKNGREACDQLIAQYENEVQHFGYSLANCEKLLPIPMPVG